MDSSVNALLIAQLAQDRIAAATSARTARQATAARAKAGGHRGVWHRLHRRTDAGPTPPATVPTATALRPH